MSDRPVRRLLGPDGEPIDRALIQQLLYGVRAVVHQVDVANLPYPPYFANLVLVDPGSVPLDPGITAHIRRVLRPAGGSAWIGGFARVGEYICHQSPCGTDKRLASALDPGADARHIHLS